MKIAILTQPLQSNYGGLLQAFALQHVLYDKGHEAWIINFCKFEDYRVWNRLKAKLLISLMNVSRFIKRKPLIGNSDVKEEAYVNQNTSFFISKYINPITSKIYSPSQLKRVCNRKGFEGYVVGSDQVWRPSYSPYINHFFLDFCKDKDVKRLSYAASFGVENWEFSEKETIQCSALAKEFNAISVRESSGIRLCKDHLGVAAIQVLDPTMLLDKSIYEDIVRESKEPHSKGSLFCYVLDNNNFPYEAIKGIEGLLDLTAFTTMPKYEYNRSIFKEHKEECVYPPVEAWLRSFMDAKAVITDSFHGCVFSIIFNKPFVALGNEERGQARFTSLLELFGLGNRLCDKGEIRSVLLQPIDWEVVNKKLFDLRKDSLDFLGQLDN